MTTINDPSVLEKLSNRELFAFMKIFLKEIKEGDFEMDDYRFQIAATNAGQYIGTEEISPVDFNYIETLLRMNPDMDYTTKTPTTEFNRPKREVYSFDYDEFRTEYTRRTYRSEIVSYSRDLVKRTVSMMEDEGSFDMYGGREVDIDYYDGETTDTKFDNDSIQKIE